MTNRTFAYNESGGFLSGDEISHGLHDPVPTMRKDPVVRQQPHGEADDLPRVRGGDAPDAAAPGQSPAAACGRINRPATQPASSASNPVQPPAEEQAPPAVEEAYLTHQAAAAMGDVHVEVEESDLVQWTMQPAPPPPPPAVPPVWMPAPLVNFGQPQDPMGEQGTWFGPPLSPRINSLLPRSAARTAEEELHRRRTFIWGAGAVAVVAMIAAVLWLLQGRPQPCRPGSTPIASKSSELNRMPSNWPSTESIAPHTTSIRSWSGWSAAIRLPIRFCRKS